MIVKENEEGEQEGEEETSTMMMTAKKKKKKLCRLHFFFQKGNSRSVVMEDCSLCSVDFFLHALLFYNSFISPAMMNVTRETSIYKCA